MKNCSKNILCFRSSLESYEIIEFPIVVVNVDSLETEPEKTFHHYVKPVQQINEVCTQITGITNEMVTNQQNLEHVLKLCNDWLNNLTFNLSNSVFVTCGNWDLMKMLPSETRRLGIDYNSCLKRWINVKDLFHSCILAHKDRKNMKIGMKGMLNKLGLDLIGRHHSGIDDTQNIARLLLKVLQAIPKMKRQTVLENFIQRL